MIGLVVERHHPFASNTIVYCTGCCQGFCSISIVGYDVSHTMHIIRKEKEKKLVLFKRRIDYSLNAVDGTLVERRRDR